MSKFILAIDQGTTGSTVSILNQNGECIAKQNKEYRQIFPKPGWVEHDPNDIWQSVLSSMELALQEAKSKGMGSLHQIAGIGITNQRETVLLWDRKTSLPVYNAIVWQCRRTADFCQKNKKHEAMIRRKTGLLLDPYFSASKIAWILKNVDGVKQKAKTGSLAAGTIDSFLLWKLTNAAVHATDVSNASRTSLMNISTAKWDDELLKFFAVPKELLPEIRSSSEVYGHTKNLGILPDGIPIAGIAGDQQAALFGQTCFKVGEAKCTYGTGSFLLMNTGNKLVRSKAGMLSTVAWKLKNDKSLTYAIEGSAFICGAAVQWLRDGLGLIAKSSEVESLAMQVSSSDGVEFVPAFTGLGAPYWDPYARAIISGLSRGSTKAHIARACLEGMALQNADLLFAMEKDLGKKLKSIRVDGGASANNLLMQLQADYLSCQVIRPKMLETTSAGAAYLAGLGVGLWPDTKSIEKIWKQDRIFKTQMNTKDRKLRLANWHKAIARVQL